MFTKMHRLKDARGVDRLQNICFDDGETSVGESHLLGP